MTACYLETTQPRDRLFHDQYEYCLRLTSKYPGCIRDLQGDLNDRLENTGRRLAVQVAWRNRSHITRDGQRELDQLLPMYLDLVRAMYDHDDHKLMFHYDSLYVYANDHDYLVALAQIQHGHTQSMARLTQAQVNRARGTVLVQGSDHEFRTYFRETALSSHERMHVVNWIKNQAHTVKPSPSLALFCDDPAYHRIMRWHFMDHSDVRLLNMLALIKPGLVRCTQNIVTEAQD